MNHAIYKALEKFDLNEIKVRDATSNSIENFEKIKRAASVLSTLNIIDNKTFFDTRGVTLISMRITIQRAIEDVTEHEICQAMKETL